MDIRLTRMARLLVEYSVDVQPGDRVAILSSPPAADLVREVYARVLERGGHPLAFVRLPGLDEIFFRTASDAQLAFIDPVNKLVLEEFEALINIRALENTRELSGIDPARQRLRNQAMRPLMQRYIERGASGELKWNGTLFPTPSSAQEADMSTRDYEDFVYGACFCDREDPVAEWQRVHDEQ